VSNTLDNVKTRIAAILAGTYPASPGADDRRITPGAFVSGSFRLPLENPKFPAVTVERRFDLRWVSQEYAGDDPNAENQSQGPHLVAASLDLRISYAFTQAPALAPPGQLLAMGAFEAATRKAHNDWRSIEWALCWWRNWGGVSPASIVAIRRRGPVTCAPADGIRVELFAPLVVDLSLSATTDPGLGT
jgi:hypothetical protein